MARYHTAFTTPAAAAAAAYVDFKAGSTDRLKILEIGLFAVAATVNLWSLERTTTIGTQSTTVAPQPGDVADAASGGLVGVAWSVAPANTGVPLRQINAPAQIGAGVIWTFGLGDLIIPTSASLAIFNRGGAAGSICRGYVVWDE